MELEGRTKLKIGRKEAHDTGDLWPNLGSKGQGQQAALGASSSHHLQRRPAAGHIVATNWPHSMFCVGLSRRVKNLLLITVILDSAYFNIIRYFHITTQRSERSYRALLVASCVAHEEAERIARTLRFADGSRLASLACSRCTANQTSMP